MMNKKLITAICAAVSALCLTLGLSACGEDGHNHTYSDKWTNDATYHWHAATCEHKDEVSNKAEHTLNGNECTVCGYKKPEEKPQTVDVTDVTLGKTELTLTEGGEETLTVTVKPDNATDKTVVWTSSDENVATVANGKVTAVSAGNATITAKSGDKSATCAVTVNEKQALKTVTEDEWNNAVGFFDGAQFEEYKGRHNFTITFATPHKSLNADTGEVFEEDCDDSEGKIIFDYANKVLYSSHNAVSNHDSVSNFIYYWQDTDGNLYSYQKMVVGERTVIDSKTIASHRVLNGEDYEIVEYTSFDEICADILSGMFFNGSDPMLKTDYALYTYNQSADSFDGPASMHYYPEGNASFKLEDGKIKKITGEVWADIDEGNVKIKDIITFEYDIDYSAPNATVPDEILDMAV